MVFRDHARVGLLWLVVTCPPLVLRSVPLRARLARPSVSTSSSARRPCVVPVAVSLCSRSSSRARPPPPLAASFVLVPHSCALRSARARAGARPVLHCAPHSVRAVSPPPLACASTHAASGARPAPAAPRATPSSPVAALRTSPAALLFYSRPAVCLVAGSLCESLVHSRYIWFNSANREDERRGRRGPDGARWSPPTTFGGHGPSRGRGHHARWV